MSHSHDADRQQNRVFRLMLIEDDPVFRLGLAGCLQSFDDLQVVLEADSPARALQLLRDLPHGVETADQSVASVRSLDLIILNLDLGLTTSSQGVGLALCQQLRTQYADTPLLLLGATLELTRLATAFQSGAGGYCLKGTSITELVTAIRQVASGQPYWKEGIQAIAPLNTQAPNTAPLAARSVRSLTDHAPQNTLPASSGSQNLLSVWRRNVRESGVRQIERALTELDDQLQTTDRSVLDQLILEGQRRELRTARWLVKRLLKTSDEPAPGLGSQVPPPPTAASRSLQPDRRSQALPAASESLAGASSTALAETIASDMQSPLAALFQATVAKLQNKLPNLTITALEIDVLKDEKKRELLYTVLRSLQASLEALRLSNFSPEQLIAKRDVILQDIWQATVIDFFGKYYTVQIGTQPIEVVAVLLQDLEIVQTAILNKIPLFPEFLAHLLFQTPLTIDDAAYGAGTVEAMARMELLLQNVMLQIANAVMQPLLNRFGDVETIKQTFYDKRLLSSRDVERFRNDLSWKYRTDRLFAEPTAIFESQFNLLILTDNGISKTSIYAPRSDELAQLSGLPFLVTLALETRDAIAPRLRLAISFLGRGVVYILTEVIGRGIGLIGRGMIKGIGNALQDTKPNRNSERWR
jgi:DNA-binding NarL/FixJ family response regulator